MRIGFAIANESIIEDFMLLKDSYNVSRLADKAAAAAFEDFYYYESIRKKIMRTKARLERELKLLGWNIYPSGANFIFAVPPDGEGEKIYKFLLKKNILVRWFSGDSRIAKGIRITIGTDDEIDKLLEVIKEND